MKKIYIIPFMVALAILGIAAAQRSIMTDENGNVLNTPLTFSNQIVMVASPTNNPLYLVRYKDLTNATANVGAPGAAYLASNQTFTASNTFRGSTIVTNANFQMWNGVAQMQIYSTNVSQSSGSGQARIEFYTPAFTQGTIFGLAGATNTVLTGSLPGDIVFRSEATVRTLFGEGTSIRFYGAPIGGGYSLVLPASTSLIVSNSILGTGGAMFKGGAVIVSNTLATSSDITQAGNAVWAYTNAPAFSTNTVSSIGGKFISFASNFVYIGSANIGGTGTNWLRISASSF